MTTPDLDLGELAGHGYQIVRIDAAAPKTEHEFFGAIATALDFPDYFGHNLDALNDCLGDVVEHAYGWRRDSAGLVIVFSGYQAARARWPRTAERTLEIIARCPASPRGRWPVAVPGARD